SMFNFVRLSDGGPARHEGPRSEIEIVAEFGERVLGGNGPVSWHEMRDAKKIRESISRIVPGMEQIAEIDQSKKELHIAGRLIHEPRFPTPSGKANLFVHSLPELAGDRDTLRLMTIRSEGQFNTVVYE